MKRILSCLLVAFACFGCSTKKSVRIGIDPTWYPLELDGKEANVFAFVDELLQEISRTSRVNFQRVSFSWDDLLLNMEQGNCEAVVSSMTPLVYNLDKYNFSPLFLETGPVLIVQKG